MERDPITELRRYARSLVEDIDPGRARSVVNDAMSRTSPRPSRVSQMGWLRRAATAAAALVLFAGGNVGLAVASSGSVPGDTFYPVERFYERVQAQLGIRDDFSSERFREAQVLAERGQLSFALRIAQEGLQHRPELTSPELTTALNQATEELTRAEREAAEALQDAPGYQLTQDLRDETRAFLELASSAASGPRAQDVEDPRQLAHQLTERAHGLAEVASQARERGLGAEQGQRKGPASSVPAGPPSGTLTP